MKKSTKSEKPAAPQAKPEVKKSAEPAAAKKTVAPKKVPTPKKSTAKAAPGASSPVDALPPPSKPPAVVTIVAQVDVGFGNQLYIRGAGAGLSWQQGLPMACVADDRWSITLRGADQPVTYKLLINDSTWCIGDDFVVAPSDTAYVRPSF